MTGEARYERDEDPLAYMTFLDPPLHSREAQLDLQRIFFLRGRHARGWRRLVLVVTFAALLAPVALPIVTFVARVV